MRRIAMFSALALSIAGLAPTQAVAGDGFYGRPGFYGPPAFRPAPRRYYAPRYAVPPYGSWANWRAYYGAQAEVAGARRFYRANAYVGWGYVPPARVFGPPTNYYAERYALDPYSYFNCPLARRGEGICAALPPLSAVP